MDGGRNSDVEILIHDKACCSFSRDDAHFPIFSQLLFDEVSRSGHTKADDDQQECLHFK